MVELEASNKMQRKLDGVYFRAKVGDKLDSVCFTDLSEQSQKDALNDRSTEWLQSMVIRLAESLRTVGDEFDIKGGQ